MKMRTIVAVALAWAVSLVSVGLWAQGTVRPPGAPVGPGSVVLSGSDVGIRLDGHSGATPHGTIVVKQNGQWVEIMLTAKARGAR